MKAQGLILTKIFYDIKAPEWVRFSDNASYKIKSVELTMASQLIQAQNMNGMRFDSIVEFRPGDGSKAVEIIGSVQKQESRKLQYIGADINSQMLQMTRQRLKMVFGDDNRLNLKFHFGVNLETPTQFVRKLVRPKPDKSYFSTSPPGRSGSLGPFPDLNPYVT